MIIVTLLGAGMENIVLAMVITVWARFARMIRGDVLGLRDLDFVTSAKIAGVSTPMIIARHIFPNTVNTFDGDNQPASRTGNSAGGVAELLGIGPTPGCASMGYYGF